MRKRVSIRKFKRVRSQRKALLNSLANNLFLKGKIKTTEAKAKELQRFSEKLLTKAKKGDLSSRRALLKSLSPSVVKDLVEKTALKYKDKKGGYTRVIRLGQRVSDGAFMAFIELV